MSLVHIDKFKSSHFSTQPSALAHTPPSHGNFSFLVSYMNKRRKESLRNSCHKRRTANTVTVSWTHRWNFPVCVRSFYSIAEVLMTHFLHFQTKLFLGRVNLFSICLMLFFLENCCRKMGEVGEIGEGFIEFLMSHDWLRLRQTEKCKNTADNFPNPS